MTESLWREGNWCDSSRPTYFIIWSWSMLFFSPVTFFPRSRNSLPEAQVTVHFSPLGKTPFLMGRSLEIVPVRMAFRIDGEVWNREKGKDTQWNHHNKDSAEYEGHKRPLIPLDTFFSRWFHVFVFTQHNNLHRAICGTSTWLFYSVVMVISTGFFSWN